MRNIKKKEVGDLIKVEHGKLFSELNDQIDNLLLDMEVHLNAIVDEVNKVEELNVFDQINKLINKASNAVNKIPLNISAQNLVNDGLQIALRQLVHEFKYSSETEIELQIKSLNVKKLSKSKESLIYKVVKQCLLNVLLHAKATKALVVIKSDNHELEIKIKDNGVGFYVSRETLDKGIGLKFVFKAIHQLGGIIDINSKYNHGASIVMKIPFSEV